MLNRRSFLSTGGINEEVVLDGSGSSVLPDVKVRSPEKAAVNRCGENLKVRIFIDRSAVEVFVNDRQYLAMRVYPGRKDSSGISLRAHGSDAVPKSLDAWQMKPIWPIVYAAN